MNLRSAPPDTPSTSISTDAPPRSAGVKGELKTLTKGLAVLDLLLRDQLVRTGDVASVFGLDKSSASRILQTLAQAGFAQAGEGRGFTLGAKLAQHTGITRPRRSLRACARPVLERLADQTGEAVHLSIPADEQVLYLDAIESKFTLRTDSRPGTLAPMAYTAIGRIFMALGNASLPEVLVAQTARTIVDPALFQAELQKIVRNGYALHDEELHLGVRGAAAALRGPHGEVVAAVGVSGPSVRIGPADMEALGTLVREEAARFELQ